MKSLALLGALSASVLCAFAPAVAAVPSQDQVFAVSAAQGGMGEVQAGHLALQKTSDPAVKAFATRMIADHSKANEQLVGIMKSQGLTPPATVDAMDKNMATELSALSGKKFDSAYIKGQVVAHKRTIALFQKEAADGHDPQLVAFAKKTLPTLNMHLSMADTDVAKM